MTFSAIQILILLFALFAITRVGIQARRRDIPTIWAIVWGLVWVSAAVVSVLPQTTDLLAARVGISRGADLIVYVAILALLFLVFRIVVKLESTQQEITKLVRSLALQQLEGQKSDTHTEEL